MVSTYNMEFSITSLVYESSYDDVQSTQSQELMSVLSSMVRWPNLNFFASEAIFIFHKTWSNGGADFEEMAGKGALLKL